MNNESPAALLPCPLCGAQLTTHPNMPEYLCHNRHNDNGCYLEGSTVDPTNPKHVERWNRRASTATVPDGFVLVPREATEAMCDAGNEGAAPYMVDAKLLWSQMLAATPTPPAVANGEPTAEHWKAAIIEYCGKGLDGLAEKAAAWIERNALARSAAAKENT